MEMKGYITMQELPILKIAKLTPDAVVPTLGSRDAAGLDLATIEEVELQPGQRHTFKTGIAFEIPAGLVGLIKPRSKLANRHGIDVLAGVIDSDYRGEIMVILLNTGDEPVSIEKGDKIAQMVVQQHFSWMPFEVVSELTSSERGEEGINSENMRKQGMN